MKVKRVRKKAEQRSKRKGKSNVSETSEPSSTTRSRRAGKKAWKKLPKAQRKRVLAERLSPASSQQASTSRRRRSHSRLGNFSDLTAALDDLAHSLQQPPGAVSASSHTSQPSIDDEAERFANALSLQRSHQAADNTFDPLRAVSDTVFQSSPKAAPASNNVTQAHSKHSKRLRRKEQSGALEAKAAGLSKKRSQRREKKRRRKESKEDAHQQLRLREIDNAMDGN